MKELEKINNDISCLKIKLQHIKITINCNYGKTNVQNQYLYSEYNSIKSKIKILYNIKIRIEKLNKILKY